MAVKVKRHGQIDGSTPSESPSIIFQMSEVLGGFERCRRTSQTTLFSHEDLGQRAHIAT